MGVVGVSDSRDYLDGLMKNVERHATRIANNGGADVADSFVEFFVAPASRRLSRRDVALPRQTSNLLALQAKLTAVQK